MLVDRIISFVKKINIKKTCFLQDYKYVEKIKASNNNILFIASSKKDGRKVITKILSNKETQRSNINSRLDLLFNLNSNRIIRLIDIYETPSSFLLVYPYHENGDLFDFVFHSPGTVHENRALRYCLSMLKSLRDLHNHKYIHLDVKMENFLLEENDKLILIDLDCCHKLGEVLSQTVGTPHYVAPEIGLENYFTETSDVWSVGICLYTMITFEFPGRLLFNRDHIDYQSVIHNISKDIKNISQDCLSIIRRMLTLDPKKRITINESIEMIENYLDLKSKD